MKKVLRLFLAVSVLLSTVLPAGAADTEAAKQKLEDISFGSPYDYGTALENTNLVKGTVTIQDGKPVGLTVVPGSPTLLNIVDLETGKLINYLEVPHMDSAAWQNEAAANGDVYFGSYIKCRLYKYSPVTKTITDYGSIAGEGACISMVYGDNNDIYMGTMPSAKIVKFDMETEKFTDYGNQVSGQQYLQSLAYHKGTLYFTGMTDSCIHTLNPENGSTGKVDYPSADIKNYDKLFVRDNLLVGFANYLDGSQKLTVYDFENQKWDEPIAGVKGQYISDILDGSFYFLKDGYYHSFSMVDHSIKKFENLPWGSYQRATKWVEIPNDPDFPGKSLFNIQYGGGFYLVNFQTQKIKSYVNMLKGVPSETRDFCFGPDGRFYVGEYMGTKAAAVDLKTREIELFHMAQPEGITVLGDKMYFGNYTQAELYILDTTKPYYPVSKPNDPNNNPRIWGSMGKGLDRPFAMLTAGDKIVAGCVPDYGILGAPLTIYDPETDQVSHYDMVAKQMVESLAYRDGKLYVGTSVSGGLGINPTENDAHILIFDMEKREIEKDITFRVDGISTPLKGITGLQVAPDGTLWVMAKGVMAKLDPVTLEVRQSKITGSYDFYNGMQVWKPYTMYFDELSGLMFCAPNGKLLIIDPETMEYRDTGISMGYKFAVGDDGNFYYIGEGYHITMLPVIRGNDNSYVIRGKLIMKTGSNTAIIDGAENAIDKDAEIAPYVDRDKMMVPLRFMAQTLGMKVSWNDDEQTAMVYNNNTTIKAAAGEYKILVNGETKNLVVPLEMKNDRLFFHVRTFMELMQKQVYWDESGIIVMNMDGTAFDPIAEQDVLTYAKNYFNGRGE